MIDIVDKKDCTGCWACANICYKSCITMKTDKDGFDYPIVNESICIKCKKCINICPILHNKKYKIIQLHMHALIKMKKLERKVVREEYLQY